MQIKNYGLIKTSRKEGAQLIKHEGIFEKIDETLAHCLPFGDPGKNMLKYKFFDNHFILTFLDHSTDDQGNAIILRFLKSETKQLNPISFLRSLKDIVANPDFTSLRGALNIKNISRKTNPLKLKNLDTIIASILMGKKIILLGSHNELNDFLYIMFESFPIEAYSLLEFASPTNSLSENIVISGIPLTDSNLEILDQIGTESHSIIYFENKICYGNFYSPVSKKIAKYIQKQDYKSSKKLILELYNIAKLNSDLTSNPSTLAKKNRISKADAILILNIRAKLYNKQLPTSNFEKLIA